MTHDYSALLAQLDALKSAEAGAVFAELIRAGLQALIEAEAPRRSAPAATSAVRLARPTATGIARGRCRPRPGTSRSRSPSCGRARSSPRCCSRAGASTRRCTR